MSHGVDKLLGVGHIGEDVRASLDSLGKPLLLGEILHAPHHRIDDAGVGVDVAGEAHLLAQQIADDRLVVGEGDLVELAGRVLPQLLVQLAGRGIYRLGVVRHDRRATRIHRRLKRWQVVGGQGVLRGVLVGLPPGEVRVVAVDADATAREVLDGGGHAGLRHPRDNLADVVGHELRFLTERTVEARPAGFAGHVGHVAVQLVDATGAPLAGNELAKLAHELGIVERSQAELTRPLAEHTGRLVDTKAGHKRDVVARVGSEDRGDGKAGVLRELLDGVRPLGQPLRLQVIAHDEVALVALLNRFLAGRGGEDGFREGDACDRVLVPPHVLIV